MDTKNLEITYLEFSSLEELPLEDKELALAAIDAMKGAYAPYSNFFVGAAVRLDDGTIVTGANQENAAYPSGLCAERTAMFSAGAAWPGKAMVSIAIAGGLAGVLDTTPASPCGACRQVMAQYEREAGTPLRIIMGSGGPILAFTGVESLMPLIFNDL